jgi:hypothetical protein
MGAYKVSFFDTFIAFGGSSSGGGVAAEGGRGPCVPTLKSSDPPALSGADL